MDTFKPDLQNLLKEKFGEIKVEFHEQALGVELSTKASAFHMQTVFITRNEEREITSAIGSDLLIESLKKDISKKFVKFVKQELLPLLREREICIDENTAD